MNEFIDPELGRMVAVASGGCEGCAYMGDMDRCVLAPLCSSEERDDGRNIIWVRAEDAPQRLPDALIAAAPELLAEVRRLTDEADALRRERDELAARLEAIEYVTPQMVEAGEQAWYNKERDMHSPTPTEFYGGGPAEACYHAMIRTVLSTKE